VVEIVRFLHYKSGFDRLATRLEEKKTAETKGFYFVSYTSYNLHTDAEKLYNSYRPGLVLV